VNAVPAFVWLIALPFVGAPLAYFSRRRWVIFGIIGALWLIFGLQLLQPGSNHYRVGEVGLGLDGAGVLLAGLALTMGTLIGVYASAYLKHEAGRARDRHDALLLILIGALLGLGCATDLFNLWLWLELLSGSAWMLVAFHGNRPAALEATVKYVTQSMVGSALSLIGVALTLWQAGSLDLAQISTAGVSPLLLAAGGFFVIGMGVKAALVPLHTWLPDAHSQAPSGVSALLSGIVVEAALVALLRSLGALAGVSFSWGTLLIGCGCLNLIIGNLMALRQSEIKRMLAYSSVAQVGYMLIGFGITALSGDPGGAQGAFFHLITHALLKGLAFLAAGVMAVGLVRPLTLADLSGGAKRAPLAALALSVAVLGLGGLPPLAGFMSKWQIFVSGFAGSPGWVQAVVIFAALNSVLSLVYYAPVALALYRQGDLTTTGTASTMTAQPVGFSLPLLVMLLVSLLLGLVPGLMETITGEAGAVLGSLWAR